MTSKQCSHLPSRCSFPSVFLLLSDGSWLRSKQAVTSGVYVNTHTHTHTHADMQTHTLWSRSTRQASHVVHFSFGWLQVGTPLSLSSALSPDLPGRPALVLGSETPSLPSLGNGTRMKPLGPLPGRFVFRVRVISSQAAFFLFYWPSHEAYGILVPWPGIKSGPLAVRAQRPHHWTEGIPLVCIWITFLGGGSWQSGFCLVSH